MKINFIAYLNPFIHSGGGEQITRTIIEEGRKRGYEITETYQDPQEVNYAEDAELNILWDIYNCPERNNPFDAEWLGSLISGDIPYVYGTGGYEDICPLGTLPCNGETDGESCSVSRTHPTFNIGGINRMHPKVCPASVRAKMLKNAKKCVFFSELHRDKIEQVIGSVNSMVAIPPVRNLEKFTNTNTPRDIKIMTYGGQFEYKGFYNILDTFPDESPVFIGDGSPLPQVFNYGVQAGKVPQDKMVEVLNRVQKFIHMPRWPEPYGITTVQAALCGCEVIENENSVVLRDKDITELVTEIKKWEQCGPIWDKIESVLL